MDNSLIYGLATLSAGLFALIVRYTYKSKCKTITCCNGAIQIERDVELELKSSEESKTAEYVTN